ncbi:MAG: energy transducer TonB [Thermoanaerobaculia bacterium]
MPVTFQAPRKTLTALVLLALLGFAGLASAQGAPKPEGPPYRVGGDISRPEILFSANPVYTELARRARVTGTVILEAVIDEHGNVIDVRVLKGLPMGLSQAAVDAVKTWTFKPATRDHKPVPVYYVLTVNFQVDGTPFGAGPILAKLLERNPDFAAQLGGKQHQEAADLLERWAAEHADDPGIPPARIYLALVQGEFQEALGKALVSQGPSRYEGLNSVSAFAWRRASDPALRPERRDEDVELGLQAATAAIAAQEDGTEAILYKSYLLEIKAQRFSDAEERRALFEEAGRLQKKAAELRKTSQPDPHPP